MRIYVLVGSFSFECPSCWERSSCDEVEGIFLDEATAMARAAAGGYLVETWEVDSIESRKVAEWP